MTSQIAEALAELLEGRPNADKIERVLSTTRAGDLWGDPDAPQGIPLLAVPLLTPIALDAPGLPEGSRYAAALLELTAGLGLPRISVGAAQPGQVVTDAVIVPILASRKLTPVSLRAQVLDQIAAATEQMAAYPEFTTCAIKLGPETRPRDSVSLLFGALLSLRSGAAPECVGAAARAMCVCHFGDSCMRPEKLVEIMAAGDIPPPPQALSALWSHVHYLQVSLSTDDTDYRFGGDTFRVLDPPIQAYWTQNIGIDSKRSPYMRLVAHILGAWNRGDAVVKIDVPKGVAEFQINDQGEIEDLSFAPHASDSNPAARQRPFRHGSHARR